MRNSFIIGVLACLLAGLGMEGRAQTASVGISTDSVLVGERFFFTVNVRADEGQVIIFPDLVNGSLPVGDAEFLRRTSEPGPPASTDSATYEVAVFGVDSALVGGIPIGIIQAEGDTLFFESPSMEVGIRSVVPEGSEAMKDLAPLATFPMSVWPWIIGAILALVAAWYLYGYLKKRKEGKPLQLADVRYQADPYDEAVSRLRELAEKTTKEDESSQQFHDELSDILRTYIEKALSVPALERTTGELVVSLRQLSRVATDYVSEEAVNRVGETLGISDLVKFAKHVSREEEDRRALELARESIEDMENGRRRRRALAEAEAAEVEA